MIVALKKLRKALTLLAGAAALSGNADPHRPSLVAQFGNAKTVDGGPLNLSGQVTVVNFWATWCVPCRAELPLLDGYYRRHRTEGLAVVAVAMDAGAPIARLKIATSSLALSVVPLAWTRISRRDLPNGVPATRVYDRHGQLRFDGERDGKGTIDQSTLDRLVAPLLREK